MRRMTSRSTAERKACHYGSCAAFSAIATLRSAISLHSARLQRRSETSRSPSCYETSRLCRGRGNPQVESFRQTPCRLLPLLLLIAAPLSTLAGDDDTHEQGDATPFATPASTHGYFDDEEESETGTPGNSRRSGRGYNELTHHTSGRRRTIQWGPYLSPEEFDKALPPNTPIKRGATPLRSTVKRGILVCVCVCVGGGGGGGGGVKKGGGRYF